MIGLDWIPIPDGPSGQDRRYRIETEAGVPVLVDTVENTRKRYDAFPKDSPVTEPRFRSAREVERLPSPATAEAMLAGEAFDMTRNVVERYGDTAFLLDQNTAPYAYCYYSLGFSKLFDALVFDHDLLYALLERHTEILIQRAKALGRLGVHGMRMHDFWTCAVKL